MDRKSASKATSAAVISTAAQPEQLRSCAGGTSWQLTDVCACGGIVSGLPVTRFPLPAARQSIRGELHVHFADIECSDKRRVRRRCRPRIGGPLWLKAFVVVAVALNMSPSPRGCCRRCPLGAAPKYNLSFWSNEFGKGSRKPKSPQNSKGAQKFKNRAYIWEPHPPALPALLRPPVSSSALETEFMQNASGNVVFARAGSGQGGNPKRAEAKENTPHLAL